MNDVTAPPTRQCSGLVIGHLGPGTVTGKRALLEQGSRTPREQEGGEGAWINKCNLRGRLANKRKKIGPVNQEEKVKVRFDHSSCTAKEPLVC